MLQITHTTVYNISKVLKFVYYLCISMFTFSRIQSDKISMKIDVHTLVMNMGVDF